MAKLAVLTSGGDAPGMNSAIRAVVRAANAKDIEVIGIRHGFAGLLAGDSVALNSRIVSNIMHLGGTILRTSRSPEFKTKKGRAGAASFLKEAKVDFLISIGGDGTLRGSAALSEETDTRIVHIPATIDNDVYGTDYTIGFDTAVNTALEAMDRLRDTAQSLERAFFVEVMGRTRGFIALEVAIAGGASEVLVPEVEINLDELCASLTKAFQRGKKSPLVVVAEGDIPGGALAIAQQVGACLKIDYRVCILGHVQRGGAPTARDRVLAGKLGVAAVDALLEGKAGNLVGEMGGRLTLTPLEEVARKAKPLDPSLLALAKVLAR